MDNTNQPHVDGVYAVDGVHYTDDITQFERVNSEDINFEEHEYLALLERIIDEGTFKGDRTGVGCYSVRGAMMNFDLTNGKIPLLTSKKMGIKMVIAELLWFLEGSTNSKRLNELGAKIWDEWALDDGDLGPIYGKQWTAWETPDLLQLEERIESLIEQNQQNTPIKPEALHDQLLTMLHQVVSPRKVNQIKELITTLKENPNSRRMIVSAWNPAVVPQEHQWEYNWFDAAAAAEAVHGEWEPMSEGQRLEYATDHGTLIKTLGADGWSFSFTEDTPTHRRKVKISPHQNVEEGRAALPACHTFFQVHTRELNPKERWEYAVKYADRFTWAAPESALYTDDEIEGRLMDNHNIPRYALTLQFYCRSQDLPIGTPFNLASYGILAHMLAQCTNMVAEELIWMGGDCHIYQNQLDGVRTQLEREPFLFPRLRLNPEVTDIFSFTAGDFELVNYQCHDKLDFGTIAV